MKLINIYKKQREEVYNEFIEDVKILYKKLEKIYILCDDNGYLTKDIVSNFLLKLFETNNLPFPINKEKRKRIYKKRVRIFTNVIR